MVNASARAAQLEQKSTRSSSAQRKQGHGVTDGQRRSSGVTAAAGLGDGGKRSGGARLGEAGRGQHDHDHDEQSSSRLQRRQESGRGRPRRGTPARKMADVGSQAWGGDEGTDGEARAR